MNRLTADGMDFEEMFCAECPHYGEPNGCNFQRWGCDDYGFFVEAARRLKQYEDTGLTPEETDKLAKAQEDGRLVELPCKAGDTVYNICTGSIEEMKVREAEIEGELRCVYLSEGFSGYKESYDFCDFGKTVFHSREEAEAALKEQEANNGD